MGPEVGWQENERTNELYCREIMNIHRFSTRNMAKRTFLE